ncbi:EmrB/QacA subfamily drug resistance transporter [Chitinophaga niastensis]|uniref:EmrB/QacA subfamily drug resistance transporter n=1 Tax=Chitinophaga niastensis TaxID=536980 RepID=A0A2P8HVN5_CHINA|nr:MFS transporter [Chitinophaga niastensis]PSL50224.1 EmrB/QacA subfamily drug resistance transporter [Chitinophaga niastensis]
MAIFFEALDVSVLNMAIPQMELHFHFGPAAIQWVQTVYVLLYAGLVLLGGRLADTRGRKKIFITGAFLFVLASLAAGFSPSFTWLLVCRGLQGAGVALAIPAAMAIITNTFTEAPARNHALGIFGAMAGIGFATGLAIGGLISNYLGWQWVFFINVPVIGAAILLALKFIPADEKGTTKRVNNLLSAVLITVLMILAAWLIHDLGNIGKDYTSFLLLLFVFLVTGVFFIRRERVHTAPLVDFRLFRLDGVITGNMGAMLLGSVFLSYIFLLTLYLQQVLHFSSSQAGLILFPFSILSGIISKFVLPHLFARFGVIKTGIIGNSCMLCGILFFILSYFTNSPLLFILCAVLSINSLGMSITFPCVTILAVHAVPEQQQGLASGVNGTANALGGGLGLSLVGLVMQVATVKGGRPYSAGLAMLVVLALLAILQLCRYYWRSKSFNRAVIASS